MHLWSRNTYAPPYQCGKYTQSERKEGTIYFGPCLDGYCLGQEGIWWLAPFIVNEVSKHLAYMVWTRKHYVGLPTWKFSVTDFSILSYDKHMVFVLDRINLDVEQLLHIASSHCELVVTEIKSFFLSFSSYYHTAIFLHAKAPTPHTTAKMYLL